MRVRLLALTLLAVLVPAASAQAEAKITQQIYGDDGQPFLVANVLPDSGLATIGWRACNPDCGDIVATGAVFRPGATPTGTVFEAEATLGGVLTTDRTTPWQGQVTNVTPPTLVGEPRVGREVGTVGGTWSGGWDKDSSQLGLVACRNADGTDCRTLYSHVIDPAYAGWYLRAVDRRYAFGTAFPTAVALPPTPGTIGSSAFSIAPSPTVAYGASFGPIAAANPGAPPTITGKLAVGQTITVHPGTWPDRPDSAFHASALRACPTPVDSAKCVALTSPYAAINAGGVPPAVTFTLTEAQLGWYIGAWDDHTWPNAADRRGVPVILPPAASAGVGSANQVPQTPYLPPAGLTVLYGPLGKTAVRLGFTPAATLRKVAKRAGGRLILGTLRCAARCKAHVVVTRGKTTAERDVVVKATSRALTVPGTRFRSAGTLRVAITYDDSPATKHARIRVS